MGLNHRPTDYESGEPDIQEYSASSIESLRSSALPSENQQISESRVRKHSGKYAQPGYMVAT